MKCKEFQQKVHEVMSSADVAAGYVRRMVEKETRGWGDSDGALSRLANRYGLPFWSLNNLRIGRAKTVEAGLMGRIRAAYLDLCERQIQALQHELSIEKALNPDDTFDDLAREAETLLARVQAKKATTGKAATRRTEGF